MSTTFIGMPALPRDAEGRLTPSPPPGELINSDAFPSAAKVQLGKPVQRGNLHTAMTMIRGKRGRVVAELDNWEQLRRAGESIKNRTLRHLDQYLVQLEESLTAAGTTVHWARDAAEANEIIVGLVKDALSQYAVSEGEGTEANNGDVTYPEVVKVKSMATQEIEMNEALEDAGIAAWETDLAELIVQLGHDRPSHFLVPAIHRNRSEVREIFLDEMGTYGRPAPEGLDSEPAHLAEASRQHLREKFLRAKVGISGANFAVAETGTLAVVESEGNGRMCLTLPETLISVVGIEKVVPTVEDLEVFLQLLPRSSTGERMNPYTTLWTGPGGDKGGEDGPKAMHVVLIDNGRTNVLQDKHGREALRCIRCTSCLNVCPVYEKVGGHAYGSVYPGPIGSILTPQLRGTSSKVDRSLPFASTLCGACFDVCPVRIPIPELLVYMRNKVVSAKKAEANAKFKKKRLARPFIAHTEPALMASAAWMMSDSRRWKTATNMSGFGGRSLGKFTDHIGAIPGPLSRWTGARNVPVPPAESFRSWWNREHGDDDTAGTNGERKGEN
ncbi:Lactate utilization protein B [Dermatophilus congolensis]|uniref:Lactate utilization protein B n=1 Tax=Dermatophilus congolensis TaxID=1863 RepID=A0A239VF14_9MICO|nr:lactate utilization protein B [Dermatophilus congolensis]SNV20795.1 Lactate utilization protein B [Dermatophilus congolensis]STD05708.1 Lactate utilization protein B [Dermatophilus congolensis]